MLKFEVIPVTQFAQNCSLIWCDETHQAALIDPGGEADKLLAAIAKRGLTLTHILLTHGHLDHVGAAAELREKTGVTITGPHKEDAFWLDMLPQQSQMFGFAHTPAFTPDRWLEQGDKVQLGQCELEVYFCPATPGPYRAAQPIRAARLGRRCALCRQHRPHRLPPWRSRHAYQVDHRDPAAAG